MKKRKSKQSRIDVDFDREMKEAGKIRLAKGLASFKPADFGTAEMTRLLRRTKGYHLSLEELKTKPKKKK